MTTGVSHTARRSDTEAQSTSGFLANPARNGARRQTLFRPLSLQARARGRRRPGSGRAADATPEIHRASSVENSIAGRIGILSEPYRNVGSILAALKHCNNFTIGGQFEAAANARDEKLDHQESLRKGENKGEIGGVAVLAPADPISGDDASARGNYGFVAGIFGCFENLPCDLHTWGHGRLPHLMLAFTVPMAQCQPITSGGADTVSIDWRYHDVRCEECSNSLRRRLFRPKDGKAIKRFFCDRECKGEWQVKSLRPISRDELRRLYVDEGMSAPAIAETLGRNEKRVWEWLALDGVETRPRGHDAAQHFKPGHKIGVGRAMSDRAKQAMRDARLADGARGLFRDGQHVLKGRIGADHPRFKGGLTPERQAFYATDAWKFACKTVWKRADAKCERCGLDHRTIDRSRYSFHVHHIVTFQVRALRADPGNLSLLCEDCHRFVHSRRNVTREFIGDAK